MAMRPEDAFSQAISVAQTYTDDSVEGYGVQAGKNCQVISVEEITGGHKVTMGYYDDENVKKTTHITIMDGAKGEDGDPGPAGRGIKNSYVDVNQHFIIVYDDDTTKDCGEITAVNIQVSELPAASSSLEGVILQYTGETTEYYTHGYFYECVDNEGTYEWQNVPVSAGGGSGDASLETAVTSNLAVGAIPSGTTLPQGTTFTEFAQKLLITEIAPTTTFSASESGVKEVGTSVTPTLTLNITNKGTGTPTAIKFYSGSTLLNTQAYVDGTNTYTFTMSDAITTTTTVKGVLEYKKSDNTNATIEKSATYTFVMASYYGAVTIAPTDKAGIVALTKNVKTGRGQTATFTLNNQRSCYCYPASMGNLTSIKDANNFEYLSSYTKTNVTVDEVSYNVYTLTDPVTATGFKQVYA